MIAQFVLWGIITAQIYLIFTFEKGAVGILPFLKFVFLFALGFAAYAIKCKKCGYPVFGTRSGDKFRYGLGPLWISKTCRKCGHRIS
jgi:hypothetical protein